MVRKTLGYVFVVLFLPLLVVSLVMYLFTARLYVGYIERDFVRHVNIPQGKPYYVWYNMSRSPILLNQTLNVSFEIAGEKIVDFYIMSNSQYEEWMNGSTPTGILEMRVANLQNFVFTPPTEGRYYLILDNTPYNSSKSAYFQSIWTAAVTLVDYSEAFKWLMTSFISLVLTITGNVLSNNIISFTFKKALNFAFPKEIKRIRGSEIIRIRAELNSRFFWMILGLLTIVAFGAIMIAVVRNLPFVTESFPELFPEFVDIHTRLFLYCFAGVGFLSILGLFVVLLFSFLDDLDLWYFVKVKKLHWNPNLRVRSFYFFRRMLFSIDSIGCYVAALALLITGYFLVEFRFGLLVASIFIFTVPVSRSSFRSFRRACKELDLEWRIELKHDLPFAINGVVIGIWMIPLFVTVLRVTSPMALDIIDFFVIDSFPLQRFQEYFYGELNPRGSLMEGINILSSDALLFGSVLFLLAIVLIHYVMPEISRKTPIKSRIKSLLTPMVAAFLAFALNEIYASLIGSAFTVRGGLSLLISLIAFGATYMSERAFEEAMK